MSACNRRDLGRVQAFLRQYADANAAGVNAADSQVCIAFLQLPNPRWYICNFSAQFTVYVMLASCAAFMNFMCSFIKKHCATNLQSTVTRRGRLSGQLWSRTLLTCLPSVVAMIANVIIYCELHQVCHSPGVCQVAHT